MRANSRFAPSYVIRDLQTREVVVQSEQPIDGVPYASDAVMGVGAN